MRIQFLILLAAMFLWGCASSPKENAAISPNFISGDGKPAYAQVVKQVYTQAWKPNGSAAGGEAVTSVAVVLAKDGTVISAKIVKPSGDDQMDKSVQMVLDKIKLVQPFESNTKDERRTFFINFNVRTKT